MFGLDAMHGAHTVAIKRIIGYRLLLQLEFFRPPGG
jgi:hypothetical protein